jgi:DNA-binding NarL/FixJ family response regulator
VRLAVRVAHECGDRDRMWELTGELEELAEDLPLGEERAAAMAAIAQITMLNDRPVEAVAWAERALADADRIGATRVRAQAMVERASALVDLPERRAEGVTALHESVAEAERVGDWVLLARALNNLTNVVSPSERRPWLERMRDAGRRAGFDNMVAANYVLRLAELAIHEGDAAAAWQHAAVVGDFVEGKPAAWSRALRIGLLVERDQLDEAAAMIDDGSHPHLLTRLMLAARRGDRAAAAEGFAAILRDGLNAPCHDEVTPAVEAALAAGCDAAAVLSALQSGLLQQRWEQRRPRVQALVAAADADHAGVVAVLDGETIEAMVDLGAPWRASLHLALARAFAAHTRTTDARQEAATARRLLERWPGWRRDEVDALLARLDAAATTDGQLTPREREVAALVAEGLSNAEVARKLFISPRTAAVHVSNIFVKLGMSNRAEVAAWAVRNGLTAA